MIDFYILFVFIENIGLFFVKFNVNISYLNAYAQWIAGDKYFFVGVGHNSNLITHTLLKQLNMLNIYHCYKTRRYHYVY